MPALAACQARGALLTPFLSCLPSGLTSSKGQLAFRASHAVALKNGMAVHKPPPPLPSDTDAWHTYGSAPDYRSVEQIRVTGQALASCPPLCCSHLRSCLMT